MVLLFCFRNERNTVGSKDPPLLRCAWVQQCCATRCAEVLIGVFGVQQGVLREVLRGWCCAAVLRSESGRVWWLLGGARGGRLVGGGNL